MTNESIERLIDALNAHEMRDRIFRASLSASVEYAKVWLNEPKGVAGNEGSYEFFFIKNETGVYVAAVLDMYNDLHVFVKEAYRRKGYLTRAMKEVILPKLYQNGRTRQAVTFEDPLMARYCAKNWGFSITIDSSAEKDLSVFAHLPAIKAKGQEITREDFAQIKVKINRAQLYLTMIKEQLEIAYGQCSETYLEDLIHDLAYLDDKILSFIEEKQGGTA